MKTHWLFRPRPNPRADMRLFCFPYAGGSAAMFRTWHEHLPHSIEVCGVVLPGRAQRMRERPHTRIDTLTADLADLLAPELTVPFAFFGHSMGALLSFALARELRRRGLATPVQLFVSAHRAPHLCATHEPLHNLPDLDFISAMKSRFGSNLESLEDADLRPVLMPYLRADMEACETYTYTAAASLACPVTVFGGDHDYVPPPELQAWRQHTHAACSVQMFPGDHFFIHPQEAAVVKALSDGLWQTVHKIFDRQGEVVS